MPTPTIIATANPVNGNVVISINWSSIPTVDFASVIRVELDGTETTLRTNTSADSSGDYIELSGGVAIIYDNEAPFDVSLTYRTEGLGSTTTATSSETILASGGNLWLRDPLYPANNRRIVLGTGASLPECRPGDGLFFRGMDDEVTASQTSNVAINNRSRPLPLIRPRASISSTLNLIARTFIDRDMLGDTLANGTILRLDCPVKYGYAPRYMSIGDVTVNRVSRNFGRQWSLISLPYVVVDAPAGMAFGTLGTRWTDLCVSNGGLYATFAAATAASVTWLQLMLGNGSNAAPKVAWRTWSQVNSDFATWSAVNSGGRTWENLLEGA